MVYSAPDFRNKKAQSLQRFHFGAKFLNYEKQAGCQGCAAGPCGGVKPGGSTWVMVSMKRPAVVMAAAAWSAVIGAAVGPMP
jgi:hypothetical protein